MKRLFIIGAGGHGKVVADAAVAAGYEIAGFADDGKKKGEVVIGAYKALGNVAEAKTILSKNDFFIVAIGNNEMRKRIFTELSNVAKTTILIHPSAVVSAFAKIGRGTTILANAVINADAIIGDNCIINSASLVDHETIIGSHSHIAQGTVIGSNCVLPELFTTELGQNIKSGSKT